MRKKTSPVLNFTVVFKNTPNRTALVITPNRTGKEVHAITKSRKPECSIVAFLFIKRGEKHKVLHCLVVSINSFFLCKMLFWCSSFKRKISPVFEIGYLSFEKNFALRKCCPGFVKQSIIGRMSGLCKQFKLVSEVVAV